MSLCQQFWSKDIDFLYTYILKLLSERGNLCSLWPFESPYCNSFLYFEQYIYAFVCSCLCFSDSWSASDKPLKTLVLCDNILRSFQITNIQQDRPLVSQSVTAITKLPVNQLAIRDPLSQSVGHIRQDSSICHCFLSTPISSFPRKTPERERQGDVGGARSLPHPLDGHHCLEMTCMCLLWDEIRTRCSSDKGIGAHIQR